MIPMANGRPARTAPDAGGASGSRWDGPPSWPWHVALAIALVTYSWSRSYPGLALGAWGLSIAVTVLLGLGWFAWLLAWVRRTDHERAWRWGVAPVMVIVSVALTVSDVPLRVRFELDRSEFDELVDELEPAGSIDEWISLDVPDRIGSYDITMGYQVGSNVILYERNGALFDDAGFAHLPDGPDQRLGNSGFEAPSFRSLGGDWYAWTASW